LHFDQYCLLVLLYLFNPVVSSLRAIQQASKLKKVQRKLGCGRASLGSLSEAAQVFNPELLKEVIAQLGEQLESVAADRRLANVPGKPRGSHRPKRRHADWKPRLLRVTFFADVPLVGGYRLQLAHEYFVSTHRQMGPGRVVRYLASVDQVKLFRTGVN